MAGLARACPVLLLVLGGCPDDDEDFTLSSTLLIEDERANHSLAMCGASNRPGFDLDAIQVTPATQVASATGAAFTVLQCEDSLGTTCPNDHADAAAAVGVPDATADTGYVSLNGGAVFCTFGTAMHPGDTIQIFESGQATPEQYRVRLCDEAGACGTGLTLTGSATIQVDDLMF